MEDARTWDTVEGLCKRLGVLEPLQVRIWRQMSPARRIELACQAYHLTLEAVRVNERHSHPDLSALELAWRVTRRLHANPNLGR